MKIQLNSATKSLLGIAVSLMAIAPVNEVQAASITLYDGSDRAVTPNNFSPQWLAFGGIGGSQSFNSAVQATNLNTSGNDNFQAGYSNYVGRSLLNSQFPILDRALGYTLSFSVEILSESHSNNQRAGFSVIVVSSDVASGVQSSIEIGFQDNRVFAQNDSPLFGSPAANTTTFDPVGVGFINYDLVVLGNSYQLLANGSSILQGNLRDYTAFSGAIDPYENPNFIFFGDNTTSAQANINFRSASLTTNEPATVPEPSSLLGLLELGSLGALAFQKRQAKSK